MRRCGTQKTMVFAAASIRSYKIAGCRWSHVRVLIAVAAAGLPAFRHVTMFYIRVVVL